MPRQAKRWTSLSPGTRNALSNPRALARWADPALTYIGIMRG